MAVPVVALVLVSHSSQLARGVAEVAGQMAPDVLIVPAGGTADGRIGTGFDLIEDAVTRALADDRSAVVLTDLGSAALSAESVLEMAAPHVAARVRIVDAPFVEGAVEAAVVAQTGADLRTVVEAAEDAASTFARSGAAAPAADERNHLGGSPAAPGPNAAAGTSVPGSVTHGADAGRVSGAAAVTDDRTAQAAEGTEGPGARLAAPAGEGGAATGGAAGSRAGADAQVAGWTGVPTARGTAVLRNRLGLHARPAAQLVRTVGAFDALVTVNGVDARSVLALVGLGAVGGQEVVVAATGPQARHAVHAVVDELENGFGEA